MKTMERREYLKTVGGTGAAITGVSAFTGTASADGFGPYDQIMVFCYADDSVGSGAISAWTDYVDMALDDLNSYLSWASPDGIDVYTRNRLDDSKLSVSDVESRSEINSEVERVWGDGSTGEGHINWVLHDQNTTNQGQAMGFVKWDQGAACHQSHSADNWSLIEVPDRYKRPKVLHEVLHACMSLSGHTEHYDGTQNSYSDYYLAPSVMATGYSTYAQQEDTSDWVDCDGNDWEKGTLTEVTPQPVISECTDYNVQDSLGVESWNIENQAWYFGKWDRDSGSY